MRLRLLLVVACAALAAFALPSQAGAWEYVSGFAKGNPGAVWVPPVFPFEDHRFSTYGPALYFTTFQSGPYVYRSPISNDDDQLVTAIYTLQRWNGQRWYEVTRQATPNYTIPAGQQGIYLPRLWRSPGGTTLYNRGYFRVLWLFVWQAGGVGHQVAILPNQVSDFRCREMLRPCHSNGRSVRLGRLFALGGGW